MPLYDMTDGSLSTVARTSFAQEGVLERAHLQRALREDISLVGDDLLVVSEEFGDFTDGHRRIDLLCVDRSAQLVVVELKRTDDGGHMELQALRYAAMVSTMTLDDLEHIYARYLQAIGADEADAQQQLHDFLDDGGEAVISREVRIVLVSAGFGKEITTTVLWLNDLYGMDIRCVRLTPYRVEGRLLLDVQQVVPLPEAADLTVQLRRREQAAKVSTSGRDLTRYMITTPSGTTPPLAKRRAIQAMVTSLHGAGVPVAAIGSVLPPAKLLSVEGILEGAALIDTFVAQYPSAQRNLRRWFFETPLHEDGSTWVLSKMWGLTTEETLAALASLDPSGAISFESA